MSEQSDSREIQHLEKLNAELKQSLQNCRAILRDCQERLAANSNDAQPPSDQGTSEGRSEARQAFLTYLSSEPGPV